MQPIIREAIVDRRQPTIRWSAVFAGTALAVAVWAVLQIFGMGIGAGAIDTGDTGALRTFGIGSSVWTLLAVLIATFVGGVVAGRLAGTPDRRLGMLHGAVTWALTAVVGTLATVALVAALVAGLRDDRVVGDDTAVVIADAPSPVAHLSAERAGHALLYAGTALVLGLGTAVAGGLLAIRGFGPPRARHTTLQQASVVPPPDVEL